MCATHTHVDTHMETPVHNILAETKIATPKMLKIVIAELN